MKSQPSSKVVLRDLALIMAKRFRGRENAIVIGRPPKFALRSETWDGHLTAKQIVGLHLVGQACLCVYVVCENQKCWFGVIDFDNKPERPDPKIKGKVVKVVRCTVGSTAIKEAIETMKAKALTEGAVREVQIRVVAAGGAFYVDLLRDDFKVAKVTRKGVQIIRSDKVRFDRRKGQLPLPEPDLAGSLDPLFELLNTTNKSDLDNNAPKS